MKMIAALVIGLVSASAFAAELKVMEIPSYGYDRVVESTFGVNKDLGRAWVEVSTSANDPESSLGNEYREKVPGLRYDIETKTVLLDFEGQTIECATVVRSGLRMFGNTRVKPTGNCKFDVRRKTVIEDDGFETHRREVREIFIVLK